MMFAVHGMSRVQTGLCLMWQKIVLYVNSCSDQGLFCAGVTSK